MCLLQPKMDAISVAKIGSSDDLKIGEQVVAIGNALGYGQSVTTGIVSAKNRKTDSSGQIESSDSTDNSSSINKGVNLVQTDAAINPGNSGGALPNLLLRRLRVWVMPLQSLMLRILLRI